MVLDYYTCIIYVALKTEITVATVHPCVESQPCQNGGVCKKTYDYRYSCECQPGYGGRHCQVERTREMRK